MKKIIATVLAMVMALALCTTAFAAEPVKGYLKDTDDKSTDPIAAESTLTYVPGKDPKTTDGKTTVGVYAHYEVGNDKYIVVSTLAEATHVLYKEADAKNVVLYLAKIPTADYVIGKVYNDFADACGKYEKPANYDATKTYYTYEVAGNTHLAVADSSTTANGLLVVDGKVVTVRTLDAAKVQHTAVPTVKDGKVTGYTCSKCKAVAVEAPNYASIPAGADTTNLTGNWYWTTSTTPSTDTTKPSPKTFDAGIAMYVGMALTSVAGSAVVIGKKKEF